MEFVLDFKNITKNDVKLAGGKGASLGEIARAGLPVPPGFVILAGAYEKFQKEGKIPKEVAGEIKKAFKKLGAKKVAVRSSATAEDSKNAAWAGQLESYLNTTEKDLLKNVQKCWESLSLPRAKFYRAEKGLNKKKISVAVVIQKMVKPEVSGVAFSVHPVTQDRNHIVIEAVFGLGEALVSGRVTPDSHIVEKDSLKVIDVHKEVKRKLSEAQIKKLAKLILKIEQHYGFPVDVEWVFQKGKFAIVQSRSITAIANKEQFSRLPEIYSAEFWARESSMPLFWLTDKKHFMGSSSIVFYKKGRFHFFYLNDSQKRKAKKGSTFFSNKENVRQYEKTANEFITEAKNILHTYSNFSFKKLKPKEFKDLFKLLNEKLLQFADIYTKTEAANTSALKDGGLSLKNLGHIRFEMRKSFSGLFSVLIGKLLSEVARKNALGLKKDLFLYDLNEMKELLGMSKKVEESKIKERRKGYAVLKKGTEVQVFLKKDADILWKKVNDLIRPKSKTEIKGMPVFAGIVRGKVRIISQSLSKKRIESGYGIQKGEILVTDMTKPDMISACKKAAAIVTDEGGILSHASIIARELKKPCIVGTKVATQMLKTGDLVEINAEKGIVRIIEKARRG